MTDNPHLIVEQGHDKNKTIFVPPEGARLGRSSHNDIVLVDPLLSRHHARLFFKTGNGLWITDLGSANETRVNNRPIQETRIHVGDQIAIGGTVLRVTNDTMPDSKISSPVRQPSAGNAVNSGNASPSAKEQKTTSTRLFIIAATIVVLLAVVIWLPTLSEYAQN
ncbi:MAG: FHA domain-containing protein, partial [Lentisphaerae bacterium]|nr:FHA domain-containing protein [Lentisphaerota bacterium]